MKLTVNENKQLKTKFQRGDFFLTDSNDLRQVIKDNRDRYYIGHTSYGGAATLRTYNSAKEAVDDYSIRNGKITKVKLLEIVVEKTNEVLN